MYNSPGRKHIIYRQFSALNTAEGTHLWHDGGAGVQDGLDLVEPMLHHGFDQLLALPPVRVVAARVRQAPHLPMKSQTT
jgi:hypothetical protein